jgi:ADP-heptose:LPS heptosyltransferase
MGRRAASLPSLADFRSALIVKPSSLGDIVHTLPAVQAIHEAHPHLRLRWLANPEWAPLLRDWQSLAEVIPFPRKQFRGFGLISKGPGWLRQWRGLSRETPEIVLDFQGLLRSGIVSRARGSRPVVGFSDAREGARWFHDHIVPVDPAGHAVDRYLSLPRAFGIPADTENLRFPLPQGQAPDQWPSPREYIVVHPWSRGEGKSLSDDALRALCAALAPIPVILVGVTSAPIPVRAPHVSDLSNQTSLTGLLWVLRGARFCISVDSGPMHMAAAVNDRTLALHTWSDPRRVGPYNPKAWVWKAGRIARRHDFSTAECEQDSAISPDDARTIAAFVTSGGEKH